MKDLNPHFPNKNKQITKMEKIDKIVNDICSGGNLNKCLKEFKQLKDERDIVVGNALVRIIDNFFNYVVWYSLLCIDIKTGENH